MLQNFWYQKQWIYPQNPVHSIKCSCSQLSSCTLAKLNLKTTPKVSPQHFRGSSPSTMGRGAVLWAVRSYCWRRLRYKTMCLNHRQSRGESRRNLLQMQSPFYVSACLGGCLRVERCRSPPATWRKFTRVIRFQLSYWRNLKSQWYQCPSFQRDLISGQTHSLQRRMRKKAT